MTNEVEIFKGVESRKLFDHQISLKNRKGLVSEPLPAIPHSPHSDLSRNTSNHPGKN
jgi:hypothetical protein